MKIIYLKDHFFTGSKKCASSSLPRQRKGNVDITRNEVKEKGQRLKCEICNIKANSIYSRFFIPALLIHSLTILTLSSALHINSLF